MRHTFVSIKIVVSKLKKIYSSNNKNTFFLFFLKNVLFIYVYEAQGSVNSWYWKNESQYIVGSSSLRQIGLRIILSTLIMAPKNCGARSCPILWLRTSEFSFSDMLLTSLLRFDKNHIISTTFYVPCFII